MTFSRDQILGSLIAGAAGDALGNASSAADGQVSDDTQLSFATCEAMLEAPEVVPESVARAMLSWYRRRALSGLGAATLKALRDLDAGGHWALVGARGEMAAGNGAAMRAAPLAFVLDPLNVRDRVTIRDVSRITHHSDEAYAAALAVIAAVRQIEVRNAELPDTRVRDRVIELFQAPATVSISDLALRFGSSGEAAQSVPLALLIASRISETTFGPILREAAALPGDADTIASIAGQVAGARLGLSRVPADLVELSAVQPFIHPARVFANKFGAA